MTQPRITTTEEARAALDAAYRFLAIHTDAYRHPHDCKCNLCEACGHAADAGWCLGKHIEEHCHA